MSMNKILVINDSRFERLILKDMLNRLGYSVKDTDEFISMRQIDQYEPDIIIVNRTMYDISGLDLNDMIKTKNPRYRCYLSSCSPLKGSAINASKADGAFQTPIDINELQDVMEGRERVIGELADESEAPDQGVASHIHQPSSPKVDSMDTGALPAPTAVNFCSNCGGDIRHEPAYAFCPFCGHPV